MTNEQFNFRLDKLVANAKKSGAGHLAYEIQKAFFPLGDPTGDDNRRSYYARTPMDYAALWKILNKTFED